MKIQVVARPNAGSDWYRCVLPAIYMQQEHDVELLWIGQDEWKIDCDILVYNKLIQTPVEILKQMQSQGMKIIVDVDDMWELPVWHAYQEWNTSGNNKLCVEHITIADMVTCTSERLREELRKLNPNVEVIPNAIPFDRQGHNETNWKPSDKTRFLYAGGVIHLPDVKLLEGKFRKIGGDPYIKNNAEFIMAGYEKAKLRRYQTREDANAKNNNYVIEDTRGPYDDIKTIFSYTGTSKVVNTLPVTQYLNSFDNADVILVPMVENSWNSFKSTLKVLEAATRNLPVICSNVAPYSDLRSCEGIMFVEKPDDWIGYIRKCIKEPEWRREQGIKLSEWVREEYDLHRWNTKRLELYEVLLQKKTAKSYQVS